MHTVDVSSGAVVAGDVVEADRADAETLVEQIESAEENLLSVGAGLQVKEVVADKGYHKGEVIEKCRERGTRTYIPEPSRGGKRKWTDKPPGRREAVYGNRRRVKGARGAGSFSVVAARWWSAASRTYARPEGRVGRGFAGRHRSRPGI